MTTGPSPHQHEGPRGVVGSVETVDSGAVAYSAETLEKVRYGARVEVARLRAGAANLQLLMDDVASRAVERVLGQRDPKPIAVPEAFGRVVARNLLIDLHKASANQREEPQRSDELCRAFAGAYLRSVGSAVADGLLRAEVVSDVEGALNRLTDKQRQLIQALYVDDLSNHDAAVAVGYANAAVVGATAFRIRRHLEAMLDTPAVRELLGS